MELVGAEVLTVMVMKISIFWDITPCSPLKVNRLFGGTGLLHLKGRRISQARNQHDAGSRLFFDPEDGSNMFIRNVSHFKRTTRCYMTEDRTLQFT
jgi:hypothetical protein